MPKLSPEHRAKVIKNLRPRPQINELYGFGGSLSTHARCQGTRKDGQPCRGLAVHGTDRCLKHGARRKAGIPSPNRAATEARHWLMENRPPRDLVRTPEWQATDTLGVTRGLLMKARLVQAWRLTEQGDFAEWRKILKEMKDAGKTTG